MATTPLPALASQCLLGLAAEYQRTATAAQGTPPTLPVYADFLRVIPDDGMPKVDVARAARISRRAVATLVTQTKRSGLLTEAPGATRGRGTVHLTDRGLEARHAGRDTLRDAEVAWTRRHPSTTAELRAALLDLVARFDLEYAHFPIGYGTADNSLAGGQHVKASDGPPRTPAHGADWSPVPRTAPPPPPPDTDDTPLTALLAQTYIALALDIEADVWSFTNLVAFQYLSDTGRPVHELPTGGANPGGWERHGLATLEPTPGRVTKDTVVRLTAAGRRIRDAYRPLTEQVEQDWADRHGHDRIARTRQALEAHVADAGLAHHEHAPFTIWMGGLRVAAQ